MPYKTAITSATSSAATLKQGSFSVDPSGQANYRIPIEVPPGCNGLQPGLALVYQHRANNGILGVGWGLSGLSVISRAPANYATDGYKGSVNYDANDRLALDGQRLVNIANDESGQNYWEPSSIYCTEVVNWLHVSSGASDEDGFVVTTKDGEIREYGKTSDSRIAADPTNTSSPLRVWALNAIEDLNGNRIEFVYTLDPLGDKPISGAYYIQSIKYTVRNDGKAQANRFIEFSYAERTNADTVLAYLGGYSIETDYLLTQITTYINDPSIPSNAVRTYSLNYTVSKATKLSRLSSIDITGAAAEGSPSLPAITIGWQDIDTPSIITGQPVTQLGSGDIIPMDVNGDGLTDIVQLFWHSETSSLNATAYFADYSNNTVNFNNSASIDLNTPYMSSQKFSGDVNGDGMDDLIIVYPDENDLLCIDLIISTGTGFAAPQTIKTKSPYDKNDLFYALDLNGDGRTDIVQAISNNQKLTFNCYVTSIKSADYFDTTVSVGTNYEFPSSHNYLFPADVNGDGIVDMILFSEGNVTSFITTNIPVDLDLDISNPFFNTITTTELEDSVYARATAVFSGDANGDGLADILCFYKDGDGATKIAVFLSDGSGAFNKNALMSDVSAAPSVNSYPMGFFGGSQSNILSCWLDDNSLWNFTIFTALSSGRYQSSKINLNTNEGTQALTFLIGDVTGNGKADFIYVYQGHDTGQLYVKPYLAGGDYPDLVNSIIDQIGGKVTISYAPLTDPNVYSDTYTPNFPKSVARRYCNRLSPAQFPVQTVIGEAVYVVAQYTLSNDPTLNRYAYSHNYQLTYANSRIDMLGRGWEGFQEMCSLDVSTGLSIRHAYNQDFPYTGSLASVQTEANGEILALTLTTYLSRTPAGIANPAAIEVLKTGVMDYQYHEGVFDYAIARTFADIAENNTILGYDQYGNNTREVWQGYVEYIDPGTITSPTADNPAGNPILPALLNPLAESEIVYHYRQFSSDPVLWVLDLLNYQKISANAVDEDITQFVAGDFSLKQLEYFSGTYDLKSSTQWDNVNQCYLSTQYTYDAFGNILTHEEPGGFITSYGYESVYNTYIDAITSPENAQGESLVTYSGYDPRFGIRIAEQDPNGFISITALDGFGRAVANQGPLPPQAQSCTNRVSGFVTGSQSAQFLAATVVTLETSAFLDDGNQGIYIEQNTLQQFGDLQDIFTHWEYLDGLGRKRLVAVATGNLETGMYSATTIDYAPCGKPSQSGLPFFCSDLSSVQAAFFESYQYDALGRPLSKTQPAGQNGEDSTITQWDYEAGGLVTETQAVGAAEKYIQSFTHHWYNGKDCITETAVVNDNVVTTFSFDAIGRLLESTDPIGISNTLSYDSFSRKLTLDNPDQNTTGNPNTKAMSYRYDPVTGLLSAQTDAAGQTITYTYDNLGRTLTKTCSDGRVFAYSYDTGTNGKGQLASITISTDSMVEYQREFGYDCYANATNETLTLSGEPDPFVTVSLFDPQKRLIQQTLPDGSVLNRLYSNGLLIEQTLDGAQINYSNFTPAGNYAAMSYASGANFTYVFNPYDQLYNEVLDLNDGTAAKPLLNVQYQYDQLNQILSITDSVGAGSTQLFEYQSKRLISATLPNFGTLSYNYNDGGNLLQKDGNSYTYNAHFPQNVSNGSAVVYSATQNACGRTASRTTNGTTLEFVYDGLGCLQSVTNAASATTPPLLQVFNDDNGRRYKEIMPDGTVTLHLHAAFQIVKNGSTVIVKKHLFNMYGAAAVIQTQSETTTVSYFRHDHKGSVTHCFDANGNVLAEIAYDAFGLAKTVVGTLDLLPEYESRSWNGEIGLYYFGARYYDPVLGTFLTPDTGLGGHSYLQANVWNRFAFELNNPINHIDPSGHFAVGAFLLSAVFFAVGIILIPFVPSAAGGLISGGIAGGIYAFDSHFKWSDYGIQVGVNFAMGTVFMGIGSGVSGIIGNSDWFASKIAWKAATSAVLGSGEGASSTTLASLLQYGRLDGKEVLISSMIGFAGGAMGGAMEGYFLRKPYVNRVAIANQETSTIEMANAINKTRVSGQDELSSIRLNNLDNPSENTQEIPSKPGNIAVDGRPKVKPAFLSLTPKQIKWILIRHSFLGRVPAVAMPVSEKLFDSKFNQKS